MITLQKRLDRNRYCRFIQKGKRRMFTNTHVLFLGFMSWSAALGPIRKPVVGSNHCSVKSTLAQKFSGKCLEQAQRSWLHSAITQLKVSLLKGFPSDQL